MEFKVTTVGSSLGFILPKEAQARLKVSKGDTLHVTEAPGGAYRLTPYDPEFEEQMARAEIIMHKRRTMLRSLSKK